MLKRLCVNGLVLNESVSNKLSVKLNGSCVKPVVCQTDYCVKWVACLQNKVYTVYDIICN